MTQRPSALNILSILDARVITGPARGLIHLARHLPEHARLHVALLRGPDAGPLPPLAAAVPGDKLVLWPLEERSAYDPRVIARARDLARHVDAHVIQSHSYKPHLIALALRAMYGAPWIAFHHGWTAENLKVRLYHALDRVTLPRADRVVAVSKSSEGLVLGVGCRRERTVMITNAVDPTDLAADCTRAEARAELGLPDGALVACAVGRLSPEKGQDVLVRAFAMMAWEFPTMVLALAGDGPERARLAALARQHRVEGRVHFLGHQKNVARVLAASDLLVLPSRSEGMPNALLEAMCVGVPAIATRVGGVAEVATDGETAWIVPSEDPRALAAAMTHAARDPGERARRAAMAQAHVALTMSPARRAARFLELYQDVLGQAASAPQPAGRADAPPREEGPRPLRVIIGGGTG